MSTVNLNHDAKELRRGLEMIISSYVGNPISAIEVGFDCDQGGWIFVHGDHRPLHKCDGSWTTRIQDEALLPMPQWAEAIEALVDGEALSVTTVDGSIIQIDAEHEGAERADAEEEWDDGPDPLVNAIGEMIHTVLMEALSDGVFQGISWRTAPQFAIEDFNGGWGWCQTCGDGSEAPA